ncbi:MAG: hypothetical protein LWX70_09600 [Sphingobacteriia bacterium]|nr:hypothetical protein [Sphingobacteriia bacterium]
MNLRHILILILTLFVLFSCRTGTLTENKYIPVNAQQKDSIIIPKTPVYDGVHIQSSVVINGYTDSTSCYTSDSTKVYIHAKDSIHNAVVKLFTVSGILVDSVKTTIFPQKIINGKPWEDGYGYRPTFTYSPNKLISGIYLWEKKIPMVVKTRQAKTITVLYPSNTENAYCESGAFSMYSNPVGAYKVSFLRPILLAPRTISFLEWIDITPYRSDINFIADNDLDNYSYLENTKLLIIIGHSEYWTRRARLNFDKFIEEGHDALILSGNNMWWQVRYDKAKSQLICYKSKTADNCTDPLLITGGWIEEYLKYPIIKSIGADFTRGGYGLKEDKGWDGYKICLNNSPLLEGTKLKKGDIISLPSAEYDGAPLQKFDQDGYPVVDNSILQFNKIEIVGYDLSWRDFPTCGTFLVMQKTKSSGIVINTASLEWCSPCGLDGKDGKTIKQITVNAIDKLLQKKSVFSN